MAAVFVTGFLLGVMAAGVFFYLIVRTTRRER